MPIHTSRVAVTTMAFGDRGWQARLRPSRVGRGGGVANFPVSGRIAALTVHLAGRKWAY